MLCFRVLTTAAPRRPIAATLPYFTPPLTTFYHFSPHLKLIAFLVKQNRAFLRIFFGKVFLRTSSNFTATSCVRVTCKLPQLAALFSRESMTPLRLCQRPMIPQGQSRGASKTQSRDSKRSKQSGWPHFRKFSSRLIHPMLCSTRSTKSKESLPMEWTAPRHEEIDLNCEIGSYANAEL